MRASIVTLGLKADCTGTVLRASVKYWGSGFSLSQDAGQLWALRLESSHVRCLPYLLVQFSVLGLELGFGQLGLWLGLVWLLVFLLSESEQLRGEHEGQTYIGNGLPVIVPRVCEGGFVRRHVALRSLRGC